LLDRNRPGHPPPDVAAAMNTRPEALECRVSQRRADLVDTRPDLEIARRAAEQWGVLSIAELMECGLSRHAVHARASNGWLHRLYRGVYAVGHANPPLEGRFLAAVRACGSGAVLSHYSAGAIHGFVDWDDRYPEVTVTGSATRLHPSLRVHRTGELTAADVCWHKRIPLTSPARTLADLAGSLNDRALRRAVRQAQSLRRVQLSQLADVIGRLGRRRGVRRLAQVIATGPAPTRSELEDLVLDLVLSGGLLHPDVNVPLALHARRVVPDFRWPAQRLVLEADGAAWHDHQLAREDDAERQALLEAHGERVVRVTWKQAVSQPRQTLVRLRAAGAPDEKSAPKRRHPRPVSI
jgi:predicted transcriptional regulator of viral defense system